MADFRTPMWLFTSTIIKIFKECIISLNLSGSENDDIISKRFPITRCQRLMMHLKMLWSFISETTMLTLTCLTWQEI